MNDKAVLRLIVQQALSQSDCKFAYKQLCHLMEREYPDIWSECYQLASMQNFNDTDARYGLYSQ